MIRQLSLCLRATPATLRSSIVPKTFKCSRLVHNRYFTVQASKSAEMLSDIAEEDADDQKGDGEFIAKEEVHVEGSEKEFEQKIENIMKDPEESEKFEKVMGNEKLQNLLDMLGSMKQDIVQSQAFIQKLQEDSEFQDLARSKAVLDSVVYFEKNKSVESIENLVSDEESLDAVCKFYGRMVHVYNVYTGKVQS